MPSISRTQVQQNKSTPIKRTITIPRPVSTRRKNLIQNKLLLEQQRNAIFQIDSEMLAFMEGQHINFISNVDEKNKLDYYYRRRELSYGECIAKFERIIEAVKLLKVDDDDKLILDVEREDYYLFYDILVMNDFLNKEKNKMIKDGGFEVKKEIFIEIKNKIDNELSMLKKIREHVQNELSIFDFDSKPDLEIKIRSFLETVNKRISSLEQINIASINDLITTIDDERIRINNYSLKPIYLLQDTFIIAFTTIMTETKTDVLKYLSDAIQLSKVVVHQKRLEGVENQKTLLNHLGEEFKYTGNPEKPNTVLLYKERFIKLNQIIEAEKSVLTCKSLKTPSSLKKKCEELSKKFTNSENLLNKCEKYNAILEDERELAKNYDLLKKEFLFVFDRVDLLRRTHERIPISHYINNSIASLFSRYHYFGDSMRFSDIIIYDVQNLLLSKDENGKYIGIEQSGRDASGLRRDFITSLTTELFEKKILISRDGTKKYFLNPEFEPDDDFYYIVRLISSKNFDFKNTLHFESFYNFIGSLLSFLLVNDCFIEHHLSSGIMALFTTTQPLYQYDYIYFLKDDFPEMAEYLFNLLDKKEMIKDISMTYNDTFNLYIPAAYDDEVDKDVDDDNIEDYIMKLSKFMMTKTILRKHIEFKKNNEEDEEFKNRYDKIVEKGKDAYFALNEGIPMVIKTKLESSKIPVSSLISFLTASNITNKVIEELKANFIQSMETSINTHSSTSDHYMNLSMMKDLFISHVLTKPNGMSDKNYFNFIKELLRFWSGSTFFKKNERYKIEINSALSPNHLPQSHTCFFTIDIPLYTSGTVLFEKLEMAISNVEVGIGLQGGAGKKRKPLKKYTKKLN